MKLVSFGVQEKSEHNFGFQSDAIFGSSSIKQFNYDACQRKSVMRLHMRLNVTRNLKKDMLTRSLNLY